MKKGNPIVHDIAKVLKYVLPLAISAILIVWLFHKVNIHQIGQIMSRGVDYRYLVIMMALTVLSHIIRGVRWGIQLRAAGIPRMTWVAESVSIFGAYALNLVFPFCGEAWRCLYVAHREHCPLSTVIGTDIGDRGSDGVMIALVIGLTLIVAHPAIVKFLDRYPLGETLQRYATDGTLWVWLAVAVVALAAATYLLRNTRLMQSVKAWCRRMWAGFVVMFHMKGIGLYIVLTFGIWICYYLETYVCFFAFPFTRELIIAPGAHLGLVAGLIVFVFGSCSMIVPSNGGLGPWNLAVMFALTLCGVSEQDGAAYSIVCWSFQSAILIASGIFAAFYIMLNRRQIRINPDKSR